MGVRREFRLLLCAVQFLTRVPVGHLAGYAPDWITRSARYFPLVGHMVGGVSAAVLWGAAQLWPQPVPVILALIGGILLTGAFHEDGLADTADGLGGGQDRTQRLTIMKDSRVGTYGVLALILLLALKAASLATLDVVSAAAALITAHGLARAAAVLAMAAMPYAGDPDAAKIKPVPQGVTWSESLFATAWGLWPLAVLPMLPLSSVFTGLVLGGLLALGLALTARRLIGGVTGDVLGGIEELFQAGYLLGVLAGHI